MSQHFPGIGDSKIIHAALHAAEKPVKGKVAVSPRILGTGYKFSEPNGIPRPGRQGYANWKFQKKSDQL